MTKLESRILKLLAGRKKPLSFQELAKKLGLNRSHRAELEASLARLEDQGALQRGKGGYRAPEKPKASAGRYQGELIAAQIVKVTNTFGFARPEAEDARDVFIPGRKLLGAMPGDSVLLRKTMGSGELPEGEVISVTKAVDSPFSGIVVRDAEGDFVLPDRLMKFPVRLDPAVPVTAGHGEKVLAVISQRGDRHAAHKARILEAFGDATKASACCGSILAANGIAAAFPDEVMEQARVIASFTGIHDKELAQRKDLRDQVIFTIDGADSKDLDDAVSLRRVGDNWELGVHIADVSYYVTHKSPLDLEAYRRGTSVYYADSVIPMLPKELSNGICSLNPGEDRLTFSAFVHLGPQGELLSYSFEKTVIRSLVKGVYSEVNALLEGSGDESIYAKYAGLEEILRDMQSLAAVLTQNRYARGGMDLDSVETKITVGRDGTTQDIGPRERGVSERIIEEFMLTANEAAATYALAMTLPFVFRVHEAPAPDKVDQLYAVLDSLGVNHSRKGNVIRPRDLARILSQAKGSELSPILNTMVLRTMAKAQYASSNIGHFGLALKNYTHFTSPIRRYPDLVIHRILSGFVTGMRRENIHRRFEPFVADASTHSTEREIAAMNAERDCESCYKAEYMGRHVGKEFDGMVSSVTAFGLYVQLENTAEGLIRTADFPPGNWAFDNVLSYKEAVTGKRIRLGDKVRVVIAGVNVSAGQVDMAFATGQK